MTRTARVASSLIPIVLFGCAKTPQAVVQQPEKPPPPPACEFSDAPGTPAPEWVCDHSAEGADIAAIGVYEKSAAGVQFMMDHAEAAARSALARQVRTRVMNLLKDFAQTTGAGTTETVDKANSTVSDTFAAEDIVGARVFRTKVSPNGTIYVLVGIDRAMAAQSMKQATEKAARSSKGNENALWQKFQAKQAHDELNARAGAEKAEKSQ